MAEAGKMAEVAQVRFGKSIEELMPELVLEYRTPFRIATQLDVYPNAVRKWLVYRGWHRNEQGAWVKAQEHGN